MATAVQTITPEDQAFIDAWQNQTAGKYAKWGTTLPTLFTYADKLKNIKSFYTDASKEYKPLAIKLGVEWLKANNQGILDQNGNPFKDGFYADIISGDAATQKRNAGTLDAIRTTSATDYVDKTFDAEGTLGAAARAAEIAKITQGTKTDPYTPAKLATAVNSVRGTAAYTPGTKTFDQLKATYGGLLNSSGKPVFSDNDLKAVANAKTLGEVSKFNTKLNSLADSVIKSQGSSYVTADPAEIQASRQALFKDPTTFVTSVNGLNKINKTNLGTPNTLTGGSGIDTLTPVKSLKTWKAPQQGVATANSPYSGLLDATLAKVTGANFGTPTNNAVYKNLTDPLTQGMGLDSLTKPKVTYDDTAKAGITGLGGISGTLQPLNTQVTSTPTYNPNQIANANTALENAAAIAGKVVDPGKVVNPPVVNPPVVNPPVVNPPVVNPPVTEGPWTELGLTQAQYEAGQKSFAEAKARGDAARAAKAAADKLAAEQKAVEDARLAAEKATVGKAAADNGIVSLTQGTDVVNQNLVPTNTDNTVSNVSGVPTKTEEELRAEKAAAANTLFQQGNITAMPTGVAATGSNVFEKPPSTGGVNETVSLPTNTVVQAVNPTSSNQTVTLPTSGPQPINPSNGGSTSATVGPISAAQNNLGPLNISNLGAVISPQAMNSNAGGVASLVGPQVTVQPQPAVTQQPAVNYTYAPSSQQQLEDQAVNAGYQGDYSDTAAMQGYLNSNAGGVASLVSPQVTVQQQPAVSQQPTSNIVAGVGTNPALRAKVLAAQAANMKK